MDGNFLRLHALLIFHGGADGQTVFDGHALKDGGPHPAERCLLDHLELVVLLRGNSNQG